MVDYADMTMEHLSDVVSTYPWFAPARVALCKAALAEGGLDAADGQFRDCLLYLPDAAFVARKLREGVHKDFSDDSLAESISSTAVRPRVVMAGMDYFSREDYDDVRRSEDSLLSRMAVVDNSAPAPDASARKEEVFDLLSETLAQIYAEQGYFDKAIEIYSKLSLVNPEKSAYFASLIGSLKENLK